MEKAVVFFEPDEALTDGVKPLALESVGGQAVLARMFRALLDSGVTACFVAAPPRFDAEIRACLPTHCDAESRASLPTHRDAESRACPPPDFAVTVSERYDALMEFLDTPDAVAVLPRAALPMPSAGVGFAYAAPGRLLRDTWAVRLTNAVPDAQLLAGWLPLFGRDTLDELRPLFQAESVSDAP